MLTGYSGYFLLLNLWLISAVTALIIIFVSSVISIERKFLLKIPSESHYESKISLTSVVFTSLLTALIAGLTGTAKWQKFDIDYQLNNFSAVFDIYLPVFIAAALLVSVIFSSVLKLFVLGRTDY